MIRRGHGSSSYDRSGRVLPDGLGQVRVFPDDIGIAFRRDLNAMSSGALELLQQTRTKATFFVGDWVATRYADAVAEIANEGHEVACSIDRRSAAHLRRPRCSGSRRSRDGSSAAVGSRVDPAIDAEARRGLAEAFDWESSFAPASGLAAPVGAMLDSRPEHPDCGAGLAHGGAAAAPTVGRRRRAARGFMGEKQRPPAPVLQALGTGRGVAPPRGAVACAAVALLQEPSALSCRGFETLLSEAQFLPVRAGARARRGARDPAALRARRPRPRRRHRHRRRRGR